MNRGSASFSLAQYRRILQQALAAGFSFQTFSQYLTAPARKVILLRHDVDLSLEYAMEMARLENELGVKSTYFVRIHSTRYNLFDRFNFRFLQELLGLGFEIGVHQEVCNFTHNCEDSLELLKREKLIIETILGREVYGVATHIPKRNHHSLSPEVIDRIGFKYAPDFDVFNRDAVFISDSNKRWKKYTFDEALSISHKILANIHPVWWVGKVGDVEGLIAFLRDGN
jgi:hypothetical protein